MKYSILDDSKKSFLSLLVIGLILSIFISIFYSESFLNFDISNSFSILITLTSILFGFVITALSILIVVDPNNINIKKLKEAGKYTQIYERFIDSIYVFMFFLIFLVFLNFTYHLLNIEIPFLNVSIIFIVNFIIFFLLILSFIRLYRCINLLKIICDLLND